MIMYFYQMEQLRKVINAITPISEADFELITPAIKQEKVKRKANLLQQGQVCANIYYLVSGFFRMFYVDLQGNEINCRFTAEDSFMVDFQSFLTQNPSRYYWQAMQDSELLVFNYKDVQRIYEQSAAWERFGRLMAEHVYQVLNARVEMLQFLSPEERYANILTTRPELISQVSQFHLSSYLGVKPESLSRIRRRSLQKNNSEVK